jgi:uncharacterized repeat protein (TIGR01451 family)
VDNDCDATIDEGCECVNGATASCGLTDVGVCAYGLKTCTNNLWGECIGAIGPAEEICDGADNDCDGLADEEFGSTPTACGVGACAATGQQICYGGQIVDTCQAGMPVAETCNNIDDDCDNNVDKDLSQTTYCGLGACAGNTGSETCVNGQWTGDSCDPYAGAGTEVCDGQNDENCDGTVDEGCECTDGSSRACGQTDTGECAYGTQECAGGAWSACTGSINPTEELCENLDNDCDGLIDEDFADLGEACSAGVGACRADGQKACSNDGLTTVCDAVAGMPAAEICGDGIDQDCDGKDAECPSVCTDIDHDYYALEGGDCGRVDCDDTDAAINPDALETCDGVDNDCDGLIDEGGVCGGSGGVCGNGILETGEACDAGADNGEVCQTGYNEICDYCTKDCVQASVIGPRCGDGIQNGDEQCDGTDGVGELQSCSDQCILANLPYCGDQTCQESENCETCPADCGECGNGGEPYCGDGIKNNGEQCDGRDGVGDHQTCNTQCLLENLPYCGDGTCDSDEACSICPADCGSCGGSSAGAVSGGGFFLYHDQGAGALPSASTPEVLGEEGEPVLGIEITAEKTELNPGDKNNAFKIIITNHGNLAAYGVTVTAELPSGLILSDGTGAVKTWDAGDLAADATKEFSFLADLSSDAKAGTLKVDASAAAANSGEAVDSVEVKVREIKVLAETGFAPRDLAAIMGTIMLSAALALVLKRRYALV